MLKFHKICPIRDVFKRDCLFTLPVIIIRWTCLVLWQHNIFLKHLILFLSQLWKRSPGFFYWRMVFRNQVPRARCAHSCWSPFKCTKLENTYTYIHTYIYLHGHIHSHTCIQREQCEAWVHTNTAPIQHHRGHLSFYLSMFLSPLSKNEQSGFCYP